MKHDSSNNQILFPAQSCWGRHPVSLFCVYPNTWLHPHHHTTNSNRACMLQTHRHRYQQVGSQVQFHFFGDSSLYHLQARTIVLNNPSVNQFPSHKVMSIHPYVLNMPVACPNIPIVSSVQ